MKTKASELVGEALDWAVAKCEGFTPFTDGISWIIDRAGAYEQLPRYSTDWAQGGPIIDRERITLRYWTNTPSVYAYVPAAGSSVWYEGETALIAAMRCYVASKLGREVEVPEELS